MKVQRVSDIAHKQLSSKRTGEKYSHSFVISQALESKDIFLSHEIISPESKSSAPHFHLQTDEIVYVLEGCIVAIEGNTKLNLNKGDSICFAAKSGEPHNLVNESESNAHVLVIRKNLVIEETVYSPNLQCR